MGSFDPWVCTTLKSLVVPGTTVLDIGANIGLMTLVMAKVAGPQSQLHSFEPAPHSCLRLRTNVEANNLTNVTVHELALSDQEGPCRMVVPNGQDGMARMDDRSEMMGGFQVPATTFDAWAKGRQLGRISVCKIDVEGHEPKVIRGMRKTLESGLIDAIVFEDHHLPQHSLAQAALRSYGFEILRMFKSPLRVHYRRVDCAGPGRPTNDYVGVRTQTAAWNFFFPRTATAG